MNIKQKIQEFNKRWDIIDNLSYGQEFQKFKTRILNIFVDIDTCVTEEGIVRFCQILGIPIRQGNYHNLIT